jgi:hypothetical protein
MCWCSKNFCPQRFWLRYSQLKQAPLRDGEDSKPGKNSRKLRPAKHILDNSAFPYAPSPLHPPVNCLQSIEKPQLTAATFSLTPAIEGVETQSFFDNF